MVFKPQRSAAPAQGQNVLERVHHVLYEQVGHAVQSVAHMETKWSPQELTKRVVRYIYNSAKSEELSRTGFEEVAVKLVDGAMGSYHAACGDKDWFFDLDLIPAFSAAAWEMVRGQRGATFSRVQSRVCAEVEEQLDKLLLHKAMWSAVSSTFADDAIRSKIFGAVSKTYYKAFEDTIADRRPMQDIERVQAFMTRWIHDSMSRVWGAYEHSPEKVLSEQNVVSLFQGMLAPFGAENQFSCVPSMLTERIGQPPRSWAFIAKEVKALLHRWRTGADAAESQPASKRRKKSGGGGGGGGYADGAPVFDAFAQAVPDAEFDEFEQHQADAEAEGDDDGVAASEGHPDCTSAEDCIGSPDATLVRHLMNGEKGDVYCATCWESFLLSNPSLEGEEEL